ncbi:phage tail tape measure protein [uncultured Anaerococcus sp.]|jgi:TP901 family phage tail tape measure protein|uniref:phage tail tape measure protein n=1 Tax=uncultured Anaerococcus sp. TaxID=293428 RepID=UPI0028056D03|nr:phage tail tape measure protein [uncultured Anaerococcus sp.]
MDYSVKAVLSAVDRNFTSTMKTAEKAIESLHNSADRVTKTATNVGKSVEKIGSTATKALTIPLTTAFGYAGKQFMDFETGLIGVKKTTGMTGRELKGFGNEISKMSTQIPISAKNLLGLSEVAGQLGIHGQKDLLAFTRVMAEMGSATNLAGEEGAASMAKFANIMGLDVGKNIRNVGNAIVRLGNNYATTENDIMMMSTRLAASGRLVGLTTPNVLGLATAMSSVGINAEAGGSAMSQVLNKLDKAVAEGGEKLEMFAQVSGMSAQSFAKQWETDPIKAVEAFMKGLDDTAKSGGNMNMILDALGIKGIREANTVKSLAQNHDLLSKAINDSSDAYANGNDLALEAAEAWDSFRNKLVLFKNTMNDILKDVFARIEPVLSKAIESVTKFATKWQELSETQKDALAGVILKVGVFAAAFGPAMKVGGKFIQSMEPVKGTLSNVGSAFSTFAKDTLGETVKNMGLACTIAGGKMQLLPQIVSNGVKLANLGLKALFPAAIIGAALVGLGALYTGFEDEINRVLEVAKTKGPEIVQRLGDGIVAKIPEFASKGAELVSRLAETISANIPTILTVGANIVIALVESVGNNAGQLIGAAVQIIGSLLQGIIQNLPRLIVAGVQVIAQLIVGIVQNIPQIIQVAGNIITGLITGLGQSIPQLFSAGIKIVAELIKGLVMNIPEVIATGAKIIVALGKAIIGAIGTIAGGVGSAIKGFFTKIFSPGKTEAANTNQEVTSETQQMSTNVEGILSGLNQSVASNTSQMQSSVNTSFSNISSDMQTNFGQGVDAVTSASQNLTGVVPQDATAISEQSAAAYEKLAQRTETAMDKMANSVQSSMSKIASVSSNGLNTLSTGFTNTFNRITSTVNQGTNRVVASVNQMNARVSSSYNNFASQFISRTTTMWNQFNSKSQQAMNRQYSTFNSHLNKMTSKYNSYNSRFKNVTNSTWRSVVNQVRQAGNNMANAYSNACSRTISLANNLRSNLISIMNSTAGGMRNAGYNAGMGFYNGLASTQGAIMGLASSIAASVSARIRSALNIHSPSRVMMDLGSYAGQGLAVGLDKSRKYVNNAVDGLSNTVANTKVGFGSSYGSFSTSSQVQPLVLNVSVGKNEFRAISRDITSEQGRDLRLEANFAL